MAEKNHYYCPNCKTIRRFGIAGATTCICLTCRKRYELKYLEEETLKYELMQEEEAKPEEVKNEYEGEIEVKEETFVKELAPETPIKETPAPKEVEETPIKETPVETEEVSVPIEEEKEEDKVLEETPTETEDIPLEEEEIEAASLEPTKEEDEWLKQMEQEEEEKDFGPVEFKAELTDKEKAFTFYEAVKSFEDAYPYIDDELMVVADGTGGAGAINHYIKRKKFGDFRDIKKMVLGEDKKDCLDEHLKILFGPVIEDFKRTGEKEQVRTSAFIASRVVLPRFVYALKKYNNDPQYAEEMKDFIIKGLEKVATELDLYKDVPDNIDKGLLPTTLVAINIKEETEDELVVDVYWAGDSRAYYVSPTLGFRQLNPDDEEEEAITNFFTLKPGVEVKLNHMSHHLKKPCALFVCSDGIFEAGPFPDHLNLECTFLYRLTNNAKSFEEFKDILVNTYSICKGDDCTIAFRYFGFSNFEELQDAFKERAQYDYALWQKQREYALFYDLKKNPGKLNTEISTVENRTRDIFTAVDMRPMILSLIKKGVEENDDIAVSYFGDTIKKFDEDYLKAKEEMENKKKELIKDLEAYCLSNWDNINFSSIIRPSLLEEELQDIIKEIVENIDNHHAYLKHAEEYQDAKKKARETRNIIYRFILDVYKKIAATLNIEYKIDEEANHDLFYENNKGRLSDDTKDFLLDHHKEELIEDFDDAQKEYHRTRNEVKEDEENKYNELEVPTKELIARLFKEADPLRLFDAFVDSAIDETIYDIKSKIHEIDDEPLLPNALANRLINFFPTINYREFAIKIIDREPNTTVFESLYNEKLMPKVRAYFKASKGRPDGLDEYEKEYDTFEDNILEYIL